MLPDGIIVWCIVCFYNFILFQRKLDTNVPLLSPSSAKLTLDRQEIIIMVGSPACELCDLNLHTLTHTHTHTHALTCTHTYLHTHTHSSYTYNLPLSDICGFKSI